MIKNHDSQNFTNLIKKEVINEKKDIINEKKEVINEKKEVISEKKDLMNEKKENSMISSLDIDSLRDESNVLKKIEKEGIIKVIFMNPEKKNDENNNKKYIISNKVKLCKVIEYIKKKIKLNNDDTLIINIDNKIISNPNVLLGELYDKYQKNDCLCINYTLQKSFG